MDRDVATWIDGLRRENSEALGFLPLVSLEQQYVANGRYVLQHDERGRRVGYLLHGAPQYGRALNISQHCIQYERRQKGYGEQALKELLDRAERAGVSAISVRCATDLESLHFWQAEGFVLRDVVPGGERRQRQIARLWLPLTTPLEAA
jgi:L-amino acid N-acyltransferase YncA